MPKAESACSRTPVEIWEEVFQYFLGPSLSNPRHSSLRDYKRHLFAAGSALRRSCIRRQEKRSTLRLVSRNWKLVADSMDDQIVFIYESQDEIPGNISLARTKHIYYNYCVGAAPLKFGDDVHLAQIVQVRGRDIIFSDSSTILPQNNVLALSWEPSHSSRWHEKLAHESLRSLVALSITYHRSPGYIEQPILDLPMLRYLHLHTWEWDVKYLTRWHFPVLRYLSLYCFAHSTPNIGELMHRHSATIEELELFGEGDSDGDALAYCLNGFPRLKTYIPHRLCTLDRALSQLDDVLGRTTGSNTNPDDHLVVQLLGADSFSAPQSHLTSLHQQLKTMKKNIHIQMWKSWEELTEEVKEPGKRALVFYEIIKIIRTVPDIVFDSEGIPWRTEAARRFESAVLAVVDE